jgi:hypothetical protein
MIDPYYNRYQHEQWVTLKAYDNVLSDLHKRRNRFIDIKDKEAARRAWDELQELQVKRDKLAMKMVQDREDFSAAMIKVFLIANLAYAKAVEFQELVKERTGSEETALSEDVKLMVRACESIALMIDTVGHDKQAYALGDIIDNLEEKFNEEIEPDINKLIEQFRKSRQFKLF